MTVSLKSENLLNKAYFRLCFYCLKCLNNWNKKDYCIYWLLLFDIYQATTKPTIVINIHIIVLLNQLEQFSKWYGKIHSTLFRRILEIQYFMEWRYCLLKRKLGNDILYFSQRIWLKNNFKPWLLIFKCNHFLWLTKNHYPYLEYILNI